MTPTRLAPLATHLRHRLIRARALRHGLLALLALLATLASHAPLARAGGVETPGTGTRSLGRAGAWRARTNSALALHLNPANLALLSGTNAELTLNLGALNACFDRTGTARADSDGMSRLPSLEPSTSDTVFGQSDDYADIQSPIVCNENQLALVPQLAVTFRPHPRVGIGFGLIAPNSPASARQFGDGNVSVPSGESPTGRLPSPVRYDIVSSDILLVWLAAGVGVQVHPRVRVGASFGWGFASVEFLTTAAPTMGESLAIDILSQLRARDLFIPRVGLSIAAEPIDGLDVTAGYTFIDRVDGSGDLRLRSMYFATDETRLALAFPNTMPGLDRTFPVNLDVPLASSVNFAIRWAQLRDRSNSRRRQDRDPMTDEVFDIELDVVVTLANVVDAQRVTPRGDPSMVDINNRLDTGLPGVTITSAPELTLIQNWKTQVTLSLGGDYNVIPGKFAVRAGLTYESSAVPRGYERLSFMPWDRIGFAFGATFRINSFDLSLAFMHLHWFTRENSEASARTTQTTLTGGNIISAGRYTVSANSLSIGAGVHFD